MEVVIDLMFERSSAWKRGTVIWSEGLNKQVTSKRQGCSLSRFLAGRAHHQNVGSNIPFGRVVSSDQRLGREYMKDPESRMSFIRAFQQSPEKVS